MNKVIPLVAVTVVAMYIFSSMLNNPKPDYYFDETFDYVAADRIQSVVPKIENKINDLIPPTRADSLSMTPLPKVAPYDTPVATPSVQVGIIEVPTLGDGLIVDPDPDASGNMISQLNMEKIETSGVGAVLGVSNSVMSLARIF